MRAVENYINEALIESIKERLGKDKKTQTFQGFIPSEYKGYISSLGASIIQSGLIPALAFYSDGEGEEGNSGSAQPRQPVLNVLQDMLKGKFSDLEQNSLFEVALSLKKNPQELRRLEREVKNASIAFKLALRTFHLKKEEKTT